MRVERSLVIIWVVALGLLLKFIQAAKLVKAHLAHLSVPAGTTPCESAASLSSSTKPSEFAVVRLRVWQLHQLVERGHISSRTAGFIQGSQSSRTSLV